MKAMKMTVLAVLALGLAGQAAKGARVQNARGVAGESSAVGMRGLEVRAAGQIAVCVSANSNPWG